MSHTIFRVKNSVQTQAVSNAAKGTAVLFRFLQHLFREVRCSQLPALFRDHGTQQPCPAGAFQSWNTME